MNSLNKLLTGSLGRKSRGHVLNNCGECVRHSAATLRTEIEAPFVGLSRFGKENLYPKDLSLLIGDSRHCSDNIPYSTR